MLQSRLPVPTGPQPANLLFDSKAFDVLIEKTKRDIQKLTASEQTQYAQELDRRLVAQARLNTSLGSLATILPNILKDLQAYFGNISFAKGSIARTDTVRLGHARVDH